MASLFSGVVESSSSRPFSFSSSSSRPNFPAFLHPNRCLIILRSHGSSFADEFNPVPKLELAISHADKQALQENCEISRQPHWEFCYTMLHKISKSYALVIQQLDIKYRDAAVILYLTMRALDTVEDDTSISTDIKVPILKSFHKDIYDPIWHFPCGTRQHDIVLMDEFHHVSNAFLELDKGCQEVIEDTMKTLGTCMAKFICKEVETVDDYDEYCHYVTAILMMGWAKIFQASGSEHLPPDSLGFSIGLFAQKTHFIKDFLDDINEKPKPRIFWPREIWSKYVSKLEDLKNEENSDKAVQCWNEMTTISLTHVVDCLTYVSALKEPSIFRFYAIPLIMSMGNLALGYDNIEVFRSVVEMRPSLAAKVFDQTYTMEDVYGAIYYYSCMMKSKVNKNDPSATLTLSRLDAILKTCTNSGLLNNRK